MTEEREEYQALPEAPASVNVRFYYHKFDVQLTVRDYKAGDLWDKLTWLIEKKLIPNPAVQPKFGNNAPSSPKPKAEAKAEEEDREDWCPIHDCALPEWTSKDGKRKWRSHKIEGTEEWCKGK